ncbi:MAG: hypothetical protein JKY55_08810 [Aliivibrio sp.]|uniref:hypothetical protein n=1 Tax=Aliivibrio sp. TaxID=1872443 RepID=UPI001A53A0EF|nr:hypothetical protein [Aliivibrio sp.]
MNQATVIVIVMLSAMPAMAINTAVCEREESPNRYSTCESRSDKLINLDFDEMESKGKVPDGYWEQWAIKQQDNPIISRRFEDSVLGFGVWRPEEQNLNQASSEETYSEWIMGHGLQLSVGIGSQERNEPRFRIDYQWHDKLNDSVSFQIEIPLPTQ